VQPEIRVAKRLSDGDRIETDTFSPKAKAGQLFFRRKLQNKSARDAIACPDGLFVYEWLVFCGQ